MENSQNAGWRFAKGFTFGLLVAVITFGVWRLRGEPWCVPERVWWKPWAQPDEHCFREWVSALGGWAAVVVAVPTILYLSKQVRDADRFHRQTVAMTIERNLTLAKLIRRRCSNDKKRITQIAAHLAKIPASTSAGNPRMLSQNAARIMIKLAENFQHDDFDEFEKIRFVGATFLTNARESLSKARAICQKANKAGGANITLRELGAINSAFTKAKNHLQRLDNHAKDYLDKWDGE